MMLTVTRKDYCGCLYPSVVVTEDSIQTCYDVAWVLWSLHGITSQIHQQGDMFDSFHNEHFNC